MSRIYRVTGEVKDVVPKNGKCFTLEELQGFVGGYIERVQTPQGNMYVDEEGLLKGKRTNLTASKLAGVLWLVGDAILVSPDHEEVE